MNRPASVQTVRLRFDAIENDIVWLEGGHAVAVVESGSVNLDVLGEVEQAAVLAGFTALLNALQFPVQVLVRTQRVDLSGYLSSMERRAVELPESLAPLAEAHVRYLRGLTRDRTLLDHRFYVVLRDSQDSAVAKTLWPFAKAHARREDTAGRRRRLTARCDEVERGLQRCGLPARRLRDEELGRLFYSCWCPELARAQRLQQQLAEYTAFVVSRRGDQFRRTA